MSSERDNVGIFDRVGKGFAGHESDVVSRVHHEDGANLVGNLAELLVFEMTGIRRVTGQQDLRSVFEGELTNLVHVDSFGGGVHSVGHKVVVLPGEVDR